jgi:hypothetical protein
MTREEAEQRAQQDFEAVRGKVLLVHEVDGFNSDGDTTWVRLRTPARVRVGPTDPQDIIRWMDEKWLDPIWNVSLVEPHPQLTDIRSLWMYGNSYSLDGGTEPGRRAPGHYEVEEQPRGIKRLVKALLNRKATT